MCLSYWSNRRVSLLELGLEDIEEIEDAIATSLAGRDS